MRLDHLAIAAETLEEGVAWAEAKLSVALLAGGKHQRYGTHNQLLGLADGLYLEVISVDPGAPSDGPRWFDLDNFNGPPRLANWICEPDDLESFLRHGMRAVPMQRGDLLWDMAVPQDGSLPMGGGFPTMLRWHGDRPGENLTPSGIALEKLTITHPKAGQIERELKAHLNDTRVVFKTDVNIALNARFQTPSGPVTL